MTFLDPYGYSKIYLLKFTQEIYFGFFLFLNSSEVLHYLPIHLNDHLPSGLRNSFNNVINSQSKNGLINVRN